MKIESLKCPECNKVHSIQMASNTIAIVVCDQCNKDFEVSLPKKRWFFWTNLLNKRTVSKRNV